MYAPEFIKRKLITIIAMSLQIPEDEVLLSSNLKDELDAESIDILDIRFEIEQTFKFKFDDTEIKDLLQKATKTEITHPSVFVGLLTVRHFFDYILFKINQT